MKEIKHKTIRNYGHKRALVTYARNTRERIINDAVNCNCELFYINWLLCNNKINAVEWLFLKQRIVKAEYYRLRLKYNLKGESYESMEKQSCIKMGLS